MQVRERECEEEEDVERNSSGLVEVWMHAKKEQTEQSAKAGTQRRGILEMVKYEVHQMWKEVAHRMKNEVPKKGEQKERTRKLSWRDEASPSGLK